jgi:glucose/arabinose dehydrogenase
MKMNKIYFILFSFAILTLNCGNTAVSHEIQSVPTENNLDKIKLPPGFKIALYAEVKHARSMDLSPKGTLFVGTRKDDKVYAVRDENGDKFAEKKYIIADNLNTPNGVAYKNGDLYVGEISRIIKFDDIENNLGSPPPYTIVNDSYPDKSHHGWKYIAFGPDGKLYVPVGAPCNICESEKEIFATITRMNPDGSEREIVQKGIRNSVGMAWHPETKELWFTDNGGDWLGDDEPACELNRAHKDNMNFGYPYCHQGDLPDPKIGDKFDCSEFEQPAQKLGPHVAPLGLEFYTGGQFPHEYKNQLFIAEHGSWNRSKKIGYRITLVKLKNNKAVSYTVFAEGWLQGGKAWGRPVDIELMADGSMLVSDDSNGKIYRIWYEG